MRVGVWPAQYPLFSNVHCPSTVNISRTSSPALLCLDYPVPSLAGSRGYSPAPVPSGPSHLYGDLRVSIPVVCGF